MNKKEFAIWAMALNTFYPEKEPLPTNEAMTLWFEMLSDLPIQVAEAALKKWVATNKWMPTIADIRETAAEISGPEVKSWGEAWQEVITAVSVYGHDRAKEALDSMSPLTRSAAESVGFYQICMSENVAVERANFRNVYEKLAEREKKEGQIPQKLKELISKTKLIEG